MMELLPDLPGTITGIKCKNPFIVQCPTCGDCYTSRAWTIAAHCVPFWDYKDRPKLRQCLSRRELTTCLSYPAPTRWKIYLTTT